MQQRDAVLLAVHAACPDHRRMTPAHADADEAAL
jgi:hypothetical protein